MQDRGRDEAAQKCRDSTAGRAWFGTDSAPTNHRGAGRSGGTNIGAARRTKNRTLAIEDGSGRNPNRALPEVGSEAS